MQCSIGDELRHCRRFMHCSIGDEWRHYRRLMYCSIGTNGVTVEGLCIVHSGRMASLQ